MTYRETLQAVDTLKALKIVGIDGGQQGAYVYAVYRVQKASGY